MHRSLLKRRPAPVHLEPPPGIFDQPLGFMRALVYEPRVGGHYLNFVALVAEALADLGAECHVVLAQNAPERPDFEEIIAPLAHKVQVHAMAPPLRSGNIWNYAQRNWSALATAVRDLEPDRTYLPTADAFVQWIALARLMGRNDILQKTHVEALLLNGAVAHPGPSWSQRLKRRLAHELAKRGCHTLYHLNPFVRDWERARGLPEGQCVRTMPDPVEREAWSKEEARERLGIPRDARIVGMVGGIDRRKGAHVLIDAFVSAKLGPRDMLMLWGTASQEIRDKVATLAQEPGMRERLLVRDGRIEADDFHRSISALDLLALPYTLVSHSSSIVIRAAAAGRPVVTTAGGWAERVMEHFELGWTFEGPKAENLAAILPECLDGARTWTSSAKARRFVDYNSRENFVAHFTEGICAELGNERPPRLLTWKELLASSAIGESAVRHPGS